MAVPVGQLAARSRQVRFTEVSKAIAVWLGSAIGQVFVAIGWTTGGLWRAAVFCAVCTAWGFRSGAGHPQPDEKLPEQGKT